MSRNWKTPNRSLPGWIGYHAPGQNPKPPPRFVKNKKRAHFRKLIRAAAPVPLPFQSNTTPTLRKILRLFHPLNCDCLWERRNNLWFCISAPPALSWFTTITDPNKIQSWLRSKKLEYRWLSLSQATAPIQPARPSAKCPAKRPPLGPRKESRPQDDQSLPDDSLVRNGVVTSSPLNCSGCPDSSEATR